MRLHFAFDNLMAKIDRQSDDQCWPWIGMTDSKGYGVIQIAKQRYFAHRVTFEFWYMEKAGEAVMHMCDNPICCNPYHLKNGTNAENHADMVRKGRHRPQVMVGEENPRAILTASDAKAIYAERGKSTSRDLGRRYGVSKETIKSIWSRQNWRQATENM